MLSEISKAVARSVKEDGGSLIFPAHENDEDLLPDSDLSVANVILAEFTNPDGTKLKDVSDKARDAAKSRLKIYADKVFEKMKKYIVKERWDSQLEDIIEFYSAWIPIENGNYYSARKNVGRLSAARKNIKDFKANTCRDYVPKSSLDGLPESVLIRNESDETLSEFPKGVRIKSHEALDAISRAKIPGYDRKNIYEAFTYDRVIFLPDRHLSVIEDSRNKTQALSICSNICRYLEHKRLSEPYIAFLCADGDKMGAAFSAMKSADEHREFSQEPFTFCT